MIVIIGKKSYQMSRKAADKLLEQMSEYVPFGIYAVEKDGKIEARKDVCTSMTQLKSLTRQFRQNGFKVYSNKG